MIEAYAIGVSLALKGNIGADMAKVAEQFQALNKIIQSSQMAVNELASGMRGLQRVGKSAADAWTQAANAMERAARAAKSAGIGSPGAPGTGFTMPGGSGATGGASAARTAVAGALPMLLLNGGNGNGGRGGTFAGGPGAGGGLAIIGGGAAGGGGGGGLPPLNYTPPPGMPGLPSTHELGAAAAGFGVVGYAAMQFVNDAIKARAEVEHLQSTIGRMGMSTEQTAEALARAIDLQQNVPGMTQAGGLHIIQDLLAVTQNAKESLDPDLLRSFAQTAVVLKATGKGDAIGELFKAMQAGELRGAFTGENGQPDAHKAAEFLKSVLATTIQTGGRVGPSEIRQFISSGGMGAAMLGNRDLFADAIAPIISMGAARAGTGLQAFAQQFSAGKMSDAGANLLMEMGLIPAGTPLKKYKVGIGQYRIPPNLLKGMNDPEANPREHPFEYMNRVLLPAIDAYDRKHYGAPRDDKERDAQRMATGAALASRIPGGNLLGDVIRNWGLVMRDRDAIAAGLKRGDNNGAFNQLQQTDPNVKMQAFGAAVNGLMVALGGPIMDSAMAALKDLTFVLNAVASFAANHPDFTRRMMELTAAVGLFAIAMAGLSAVFLVAGPMIAVLGLMPAAITALAGATALFAAGTPAGLALIALTAGLGALAYVLSKMSLPDWFKGSSTAPNPDDHGSAPGEDFGNIRRPGSYVPPARSGSIAPTPIKLYMDGRQVGEGLMPHMANSLSGPSRGTTSYDLRVTPSFSGAMSNA